MRYFYLILITLFLSGCSSVVKHEISKPDQVTLNAWDFAVLVNEYRERKGLLPLEWDPDLWRVAFRHNEDMRDRDFFSHFNPDNETLFERLNGVYIAYYRAGENLAVGQTTPDRALCDWLRSYKHRRNIESGLFTHHAVAYDSIGNYWTHLFINYGYEKPFPLIELWSLYPRTPLKD